MSQFQVETTCLSAFNIVKEASLAYPTLYPRQYQLMSPLQLYRGQAGPDPAAAGLAHGELPERRRPHLPRGARQVGQERILGILDPQKYNKFSCLNPFI